MFEEQLGPTAAGRDEDGGLGSGVVGGEAREEMSSGDGRPGRPRKDRALTQRDAATAGLEQRRASLRLRFYKDLSFEEGLNAILLIVKRHTQASCPPCQITEAQTPPPPLPQLFRRRFGEGGTPEGSGVTLRCGCPSPGAGH